MGQVLLLHADSLKEFPSFQPWFNAGDCGGEPQPLRSSAIQVDGLHTFNGMCSREPIAASYKKVLVSAHTLLLPYVFLHRSFDPFLFFYG